MRRWEMSSPAGTAKEKFETVDVKPDYLKRLAELIDIKAIAKAKLRIVVDPFWGAGRGYAQQLLTENGVSAVSVHDYRDVSVWRPCAGAG